MKYKQIKMKKGETIVLESPAGYLSVGVDKKGYIIYHTETKSKGLM